MSLPIATGGTVHMPAGITLTSALAQLRNAGYGLRSGARGRLVAYRLP